MRCDIYHSATEPRRVLLRPLLQLAANVAGGPVYQPIFFWMPALVSVVAFVWRYCAPTK